MRLFPALAAALLTTTMIAACNRGMGPSSDQPQGDQAAEQPVAIPSASTASDTNAASNSTASTSAPPITSTSTSTATATAIDAPSATARISDAASSTATTSARKLSASTRHGAKHHRKHHRAVAKNHRKHKHGRQDARVHVGSANAQAAMLDTPQSDSQADTQADREEFKRQMQSRVANIADGVSGYHNQASITDSLSQYAQKVEDIKIANVLARRQLKNIDTVSNDQWPSFRSNFQSQISQLEHDYQGVKQASR